jgi:hypothetical protein
MDAQVMQAVANSQSWSQLFVILAFSAIGGAFTVGVILFKIGRWFGELKAELQLQRVDLARVFEHLNIPQPSRQIGD